MTQLQLTNHARKSVERWLEHDEDQRQIYESTGKVLEAATEKLKTLLKAADEEGQDFDLLTGPKSLLRFPEVGGMVVVRRAMQPVDCEKLRKLEEREKHHKDQLAKISNERKKLIADLKVAEHQFTTKSITIAYKECTK